MEASESSRVEQVTTEACAALDDRPAALIEILHRIHMRLGTVPDIAIRVVADRLNLSRAEVYGTQSFYRDFETRDPALRDVRICMGEACRSRGSASLLQAVKPALDAGGKATVREVFCLGNCSLAPSIWIDGEVHGRIADADEVFLLTAGVQS